MLAANINCRNSVYNNVSSNVGVFDFFKSPGNIVFYTGQRTAINFLGPSAPSFGVVCASSATWLFPFACEVFVLSNKATSPSSDTYFTLPVPGTWFKLRLIITISRSARWLLGAVNRYPWDTRTVEFDLSRALFLSKSTKMAI
jgi:hypothetical protein